MAMPEPTQPKYRCPNCGKGPDDEIALSAIPSDGLVRCERCHWTGSKASLIRPVTLHCPKCGLGWMIRGGNGHDPLVCGCGWKGLVSNLERRTKGEKRLCPYRDPECGCRNELLPTKTHMRKAEAIGSMYGSSGSSIRSWDCAVGHYTSASKVKRENELLKAFASPPQITKPTASDLLNKAVNAKLEKEAMSESDTITYMQYDDGQPIDCGTCTTGHGIEEYCGLCQQCWLNLEPAERAILQGKEPPVKEVVEHRTKTYVVNPPNGFLKVLDLCWRGGVTGALITAAWMRWKGKL